MVACATMSLESASVQLDSVDAGKQLMPKHIIRLSFWELLRANFLTYALNRRSDNDMVY